MIFPERYKGEIEIMLKLFFIQLQLSVNRIQSGFNHLLHWFYTQNNPFVKFPLIMNKNSRLFEPHQSRFH